MKPNPYITVKSSPIEGVGVFARIDIPKGTKIIRYIGEKITKKESDELEDQRYIFNLNDKYDLDGNYDWNLAGFINHCCDPNCEPENHDDEIWIIAMRDIKAGEELSYNYGYDLEDYKDWPCNCGSPKCVGYMLAEEYWDKLERKEN